MEAQNTQISLSGTYGIIGINYREDFIVDKVFRAVGTSLGLEIKFGKHVTAGGDIDWQRFESEPSIAVSSISSTLPNLIYAIDRHQFNIRPTLRYYFKETFQGLYFGVFGTYSYLTVATSDYPKAPSYLSDIYRDPSDHFGMGGGLTYGYRLKLTSALKASAFGSHQLLWNDIPKYQQQDHQWGLGLNWVF